MIGPDDIEAFEKYHGDAMKAADEAMRRRKKGLPSDRWYDGTDGADLAWRGAEAYRRITELYRDAVLLMISQQYQAGLDAMDAAKDPMRE